MASDAPRPNPDFPWDCRRPDNKFLAYYFGFEPTGDTGLDSVLMAVAFAGKMSHSTEEWSEVSEGDGNRTLAGWIQHAAELAASRHRADLRDAFDAGARAMGNAMSQRMFTKTTQNFLGEEVWDGMTYTVDNSVVIDITKLPGRPQ